MRISSNNLGLIAITGVLVAVYAPLLMKAILYYFDIRGIYPLSLLLVSIVSTLLITMARRFYIFSIDYAIFLFFLYILTRFIFDGQTVYLSLFLTQAIFPYILGRLMVGVVVKSITTYLYYILGITIMFLLFEYFSNPDAFQGDRLRLFESSLSSSGDETGGATQHYAGSLFGVTTIISFLCLMARKEATSGYQSPTVIDYLVFSVSTAGLFVLGSKSALVAVIACLIFISVRVKGLLGVLKFFLGGALPLFIAFQIISSDRQGFFLELLSTNYFEILSQDFCFTPEDGGSIAGRLTMISDAFYIWREHFLVGAGPGSFGLLDCDTAFERDFNHPHNIIFGLLAETGILGFTLFIIPLVLLYRRLGAYAVFSIQGQFGIILLFELFLSFFVSSGYIGNTSLYLFFGLCASSVLQRRGQAASVSSVDRS